MKSYLIIAVASVLTLSAAPGLRAHCQVPCGIYSDDTVLKDLHTHQATISKAMEQIAKLSKKPGENANQLTRWVVNKEEHATKIQQTMTQYFLAQRVKLTEADSNNKAYIKKISLIHQIIVHAMKCKQSTDLDAAAKLHQSIALFTKAYQTK
ncbi:MAG: superoxide dismutase, Ni [Verrucomicrobiae bacterium]|nr:superoxide dismutase, Ni [Verrucomicrobiae bacterium]NNJ41842.1 hypothetical protein [Akkermansiaceae bacterium]